MSRRSVETKPANRYSPPDTSDVWHCDACGVLSTNGDDFCAADDLCLSCDAQRTADEMHDERDAVAVAFGPRDNVMERLS